MLASYLPGLIPGGIGVKIAFLGWMVPLLACSWVLQKRLRRVSFPYAIWLPWVTYSLFYLLGAEEAHALQRTIMLFTPIVVGAAFSCLRISPVLLRVSERWLRGFLWIFLGAAGMATGLLSSGQLAEVTGFAAGSITASLLASWFAARYVFRQRRALSIWALLALIPVLANTRTGMVAVGLTLPLTLAPLSLARRLVIVGVVAWLGLMAFQTEHVQKKMFYSGHGTLTEAVEGVLDLFFDAGEATSSFATTGRKTMAKELQAGIQQAYWWGHGASTTEPIAYRLTGVTHPHNDWLRLQYEYGTFGMVLFLLAMAMQCLHAWRGAARLRQANPSAAIYLYAGATSFLPMALFMFSDNVILYAAWFGNLQFAMLGLGYAALRDDRCASRPQGKPA
ncbi:hypothetical protein JCM19379_19810 [Methyloparacoccus murrellii]